MKVDSSWLVLGALVVVGVVLVRRSAADVADGASDLAAAVLPLVNPNDRRNIVNQAVQDIADTIDDGDRTNDSANIGRDLRLYFFPEERALLERAGVL